MRIALTSAFLDSLIWASVGGTLSSLSACRNLLRALTRVERRPAAALPSGVRWVHRRKPRSDKGDFCRLHENRMTGPEHHVKIPFTFDRGGRGFLTETTLYEGVHLLKPRVPILRFGHPQSWLRQVSRRMFGRCQGVCDDESEHRTMIKSDSTIKTQQAKTTISSVIRRFPVGFRDKAEEADSLTKSLVTAVGPLWDGVSPRESVLTDNLPVILVTLDRLVQKDLEEIVMFQGHGAVEGDRGFLLYAFHTGGSDVDGSVAEACFRRIGGPKTRNGVRTISLKEQIRPWSQR